MVPTGLMMLVVRRCADDEPSSTILKRAPTHLSAWPVCDVAVAAETVVGEPTFVAPSTLPPGSWIVDGSITR